MADEVTTPNADADAAAAAAAPTTGHQPPATTPPTVAEITAAHATQMKAALDVARTALQAANPDLPAATFQGDDLNALTGSVTSARAIADHVREQIAAEKPGAPALPGAAGTTRQPVTIPDGASGVARLSYALARGDKATTTNAQEG